MGWRESHIENYTDEQTFIGNRLKIGSVIMEVSMPTVRCSIPGKYIGISKLTKWMIGSLRTGFYMRIIQPGHMCIRDEIEIIEQGNSKWSIARLSSVFYENISDVRPLKL